MQVSDWWMPDNAAVYVVGGALRDHVLGRPVKDFDLVVQGDARSVSQEMARRNGSRCVVLGSGEAVSYRIPAAFGWVDVCAVFQGDILKDLSRRDFTMNAMAVEAATGKWIDPLNGRSDIHHKIIRMVSPGAFKEDPIRILRGFRFAGQLDFLIEKETQAAMAKYAQGLTGAAAERIRDELAGLLKTPGSSRWIRAMADGGILSMVLPEVGQLSGCSQNQYHAHDVLTHTLNTLDMVEAWICRCPEVFTPWADRIPARIDLKDRMLLKLAALLHDVGKPGTRTVDDRGGIHFYGHEKVGAKMAEEKLRLLRFSEKEIAQVSILVAHHLKPMLLYRSRGSRGSLPNRGISRFFIQCGKRVPDILLHSLADGASKGTGELDSGYSAFLSEMMERYFRLFEQEAAIPLLITGRDLKEGLGLTPGPIFKKILNEVRELQIAGEISTRAAAIDRVIRLYGKDTEAMKTPKK